MKNKTITHIIGFCLSTALSLGLNAQSSSANPQMFQNSTLLVSSNADANADKLTLEKMKAQNSRMFHAFSRDFKNASDIQMSNTDDNYTFIYCRVDGIVNRILYNQKGRWQRTIRSYGENDLPADIRETVQASFPKYSIFGVTEVQACGKKAYLVDIESKKSWKTIRVVDGEMDIYKEYDKQ